MKYFLLKTTVDTEETGNQYPAVVSVKDYEFKSEYSAHKLRTDSFPNFIPDLRFDLVNGAKLTDVIGQATISARGLLVSKQVKEIFTNYSCIPYKTYKAFINIKSKKEEYYWIHFVWKEGIELIDYKSSKWYIKRISKNLGEIKIESRKEHLLKQGELGFIKMIHGNPIVMRNPNFDVFYDPLNLGIYISESIKKEFELKRITGVEIKENERLIIKN